MGRQYLIGYYSRKGDTLFITESPDGYRLTPYNLAPSYAHGIASNHPFLDGNKRTSLVVSELFLALNGVALTATDEAATVTRLKLASGTVSEAELGSWIAASSRPDRALAIL